MKGGCVNIFVRKVTCKLLFYRENLILSPKRDYQNRDLRIKKRKKNIIHHNRYGVLFLDNWLEIEQPL